MKIKINGEVLNVGNKPVSEQQKIIEKDHEVIAFECGMKLKFTKDGTRSFAINGCSGAIEVHHYFKD